MDPIKVNVDEQFLNATHFAGMTKAEAVKRMKADGITNNTEWAEKAWSAARKAVTEATNVSEADQEKAAQLKEKEDLEALNRTRATTGVDEVKK